MQKKFITNLGILLFLNLLIKPFWILGIEPQVQGIVGNANYGEYFALFNFTFLLNIILDVGITNFNNKNIAQNNHLLTKHFSGLFLLKLILSLIYIVVILLLGLLIGYDFRLMKLLIILGFNQFLISIVLYLRSNILGLHLFRTDSIISVLDRLIMIGLCAAILWGDFLGIKMDIMWFVYAQTAAYFITALIAFIIVFGKTENLKMKLSLPFSIMILKKSFPFAILVLLMTFYNRIDAVMLERILPRGIGAFQAGIYAKAYRLLDAVNMIAYLFSIILLPTFSRMIKYRESVEQLTKLSFTLLFTPAVIIASTSFFYRYELMTLLYGNDQLEETTNVFCILMSCFVAISTTYVFGTLLTANGNLKELNLMASTGMIISLVLNVILIPRFFAIGSAFISLFVQIITALIQVLLVKYKFGFRTNYRLLFILLLFVSGVVSITLVLQRVLFFRWELNLFLTACSGIAWAFVTRLLSIKGMVRILKYG